MVLNIYFLETKKAARYAYEISKIEIFITDSPIYLPGRTVTSNKKDELICALLSYWFRIRAFVFRPPN